MPANSNPFDQFHQAKTSGFEALGPAAHMINNLSLVMTLVFTVVFVFVLGLLLWAFFRKKSSENGEAPGGDQRFIVVGGILFPSVILIPLLIYTLMLTTKLKSKPSDLVIKLTGYMWWWDVDYEAAGVRIANEIYIPVGRPVKLVMTSADVIHSFWPPNLSGKTDLIPGQITTHWLEASEPGTYRAQCAEFCGLQHARMALFVIALPEAQFQEWLKTKAAPIVQPFDSVLVQGQKAFDTEGCAACHTIRGTPFAGVVGPDLTHIGSRLSLGAGVLPNTYGNLSGWVANPQALKPGNLMPPSYIAAENFHPLMSYLMSLK